jgi:hypothetical protein
MMFAQAKTGNKICGKAKKIFLCRWASIPPPFYAHWQQKNKDKIKLYSVFPPRGVLMGSLKSAENVFLLS